MKNIFFYGVIIFIVFTLAFPLASSAKTAKIANSVDVLGVMKDAEVPVVEKISEIGMKNPAAVYCTYLGYEREIVTNKDGSQYGNCILPDDSKCEEWQFLEGKCGKKYNFCSNMGYNTIIKKDGKDGFTSEYAVCIDKRGKEIGSVTILTDLIDKAVTKSIKPMPSLDKFNIIKEGSRDLPAAFDWRNFLGQDFMTPVKDQGCQDCWAHSAVGATEGMYDIRNGASYNLDMSEQQLISAGGYCAGYGCDPYSNTVALGYIRDSGLVDEACFPYAGSEIPCNLCGDWQSRLNYIDDYDLNAIPDYDVEAVKDYLVNNGPISTLLGIGNPGSGFDGNDIYRCDEANPGFEIDHAVVMAGYNEAEQYWIIKNSWGNTWHGDGYFKVGFGECEIDRFPTIVELEPKCGDIVIYDMTLNEDLNACSGDGLLIENDGVILDCNGHSIIGTGTGNGINLNSRSNVVIKNCIIEGFDTGINLVDSENNEFIDNIFVNNDVNAYEDADSNNNVWNEVDKGNYWDDYSGFGPYVISGLGDGVDNKPYLDEADVTTFSNDFATEQLTFSGSDITRYIELPKDNLALAGDFEVTGIVSYLANDDEFQDDWDSAGSFYLPATYGPEKAVDGEYDTKSICVYDTYCDIFEYYDRDPSITSATWTFKYQLYSGAGGAKLECWDYNVNNYVQFFYNTVVVPYPYIQTRTADIPAACLSGPQLKVRTPMNGLGGGGFRLFESKVTWDEPMYPTNPEIEIGTDDNNPEWSYSGIFDQSNVDIGDFSYALYKALNHGACDCTGCSLDGDNCLIPVKFHSATGGILEYSNIVVEPASPFVDTDEDGVADVNDNCVDDYNPAQGDIDIDGIGDVCDDGDSGYEQYFFAEYLDTNDQSYDSVMGGGPCNQVGECEYSDQTTDIAYCNGPNYPNYCVYEGTCYEGDGTEILDIDGDNKHEAVCVGNGWWDLDTGLPGMEVCELGGYTWAESAEGTSLGEYEWNYNGYGCCGDDEGEYYWESDQQCHSTEPSKKIPMKRSPEAPKEFFSLAFFLTLFKKLGS